MKEMRMSSGLIEKNVFHSAPFENWKSKNWIPPRLIFVFYVKTAKFYSREIVK